MQTQILVNVNEICLTIEKLLIDADEPPIHMSSSEKRAWLCAHLVGGIQNKPIKGIVYPAPFQSTPRLPEADLI